MTQPDFSDWLERAPYSMGAAEKSAALTDALAQLTQWHRAHCPAYEKVLQRIERPDCRYTTQADIAFLPVRLFKEFDLLSIERSQVFKTMTSSGTSGQQVSRIYLDRATAAFQTKTLAKLVGDVLGKKRLPMLVIDAPSVLKDRQAFSARGAGILGFSMFGQDVTYALNDAMELDLPAIHAFLERHGGQPIFLFGFTFMVWQYFCQALLASGTTLSIPQGVLLHGGGWKKLQDQAVDNPAFRQAMLRCAGVSRVVNYYGMVEQTGSIFMECEAGHLHAPIFSDIVIRSPDDFRALAPGESGIIEALSILPGSYPGHALLTEDMGRIDGEDDCPCGRLGKYFSVTGRVAQAEVRGCSDTYESRS